MDIARILSRLRSKHAAKTRKTEGRMGLPSLLLQTVKGVPSPAGKSVRKDQVAQTESQCQELWELFEQLERAEGSNGQTSHTDVLERLITLAYEFDLVGLIALLDSVPTLNPSTKDYLPEALRKLGRYLQVARNLTDAAWSTKYTVFKNITVRPVVSTNVHIETIKDRLEGFDEAMSRFKHSNLNKLSIARGSRASAQKRYHDRMFNSSTRWKVHAEVQLLLFYEHDPTIPRPRIICSSKSACYLCNLFFKIHGEFQIPRTHGKIYDKWTLPYWLATQSHMNESMSHVLLRFNRALESKILEVLMRRQAQKVVHPNESTIALYEPWSSNSTIRSAEPIPTNSLHPHRPTNSSQGNGERGICPLTDSIPEVAEDSRGQSATQSIQQSVLESQEQSSDVQSVSTCSLCLGDRVRKKVIDDGRSLAVRASGINFDFVVSPDSNQLGNVDGKVTSAFWITIETVHCQSDAPHDEEALVIDVNALQPGRDTVVPVGAGLFSNKIFVKRGNQAVSITFES